MFGLFKSKELNDWPVTLFEIKLNVTALKEFIEKSWELSPSKYPRPKEGEWSEETLEIPMYLLPPIPTGAKYGRDAWYHPNIKEMSPYIDGSITIKSPKYSILYWGIIGGLFYAYLDTEDGKLSIFELPHIDVLSALSGLETHKRNHKGGPIELMDGLEIDIETESHAKRLLMRDFTESVSWSNELMCLSVIPIRGRHSVFYPSID
jgi:hypothetical protein